MILRAFATGIVLLFGPLLFAQKPEAAAIKVHEGVELHDKGEFKKAVKKYDDALALDTDNALAMAEKALTLNAMGEYEKSAALCQEIILKHNSAREMPMVYVTYGNCMDQLHRPEASLRVYEQGISVLPELALLHFNKGVTLFGMDSLAAADNAFQRSARLDPYHPGTQSVMARLQERRSNSVPATLALCRFLILEPEGSRAVENLTKLHRLTTPNVKAEKKGNTTIYLDDSKLGQLEDTTIHENDFRMAETSMELLGSMNMAALITGALKEEGVKTDPLNPATTLKMQLDFLADDLKRGRAKNFGFYWEYHATWISALKDADHMEALCYIAHASSGDKAVRSWLENNREKLGAYYDWEEDYTARFLKEKK